MSSRRRAPRSAQGGDYDDLDEDELVAELRRRARAWLTSPRRAAPVEPEPETAPLSPSPPTAPEPEPLSHPLPDAGPAANDASPLAPLAALGPKATRRIAKREQEALIAFRRRAWWWLRPLSKPETSPENTKRRRSKKDAAPANAALELRRRAWAWFAPRAGETRTGTGASDLQRALAANEVVRSHLRGVLEAVIFASEHPMPARELARIAGADLKVVRILLAELVVEYQPRGVRLDEIAGGFVFRTSPAFAPFVREQVAKKPVKMTRAQIETLAIVAYRQPITRPEIDDVRGVDSGAVLKSLLEREVVRIIGKRDEPGRPLLYGTTATFLELFGLRALADLPTLREFTELNDESKRVFDREMEGGLMGGEGSMNAPNAPAEHNEPGKDAPQDAPPDPASSAGSP